MKKIRLLGVVCACALTLVTTSTNANLIGRLETSSGSGVFQAFYDDQLDITWMADADLTNSKDVFVNQNGLAITQIFGGVTGWRLPSMDVNGDGTIVDCSTATQTACMDNEYGHLFYYGAGTIQGSGISATTPGVFNSVQADWYWPSIVLGGTQTLGPSFNFNTGTQTETANVINFPAYAWAVLDGDIATVPVPAAVWLFGSGLVGLAGIGRRRRQA